VEYLLSHQAGLPAVASIIPRELGYSWTALVDALAAQAPWWEPGTKHGYHAVTFGHLVGELIRRVTGKSVGTYWRSEIAEPAGIDFHIGFGAELDPRVAQMVMAPMQPLEPDHPLTKAFFDPNSVTFKAFMVTPEPLVNPGYVNTREWREAEVPAANGHSNARALARMYGALAANGSIDGVHILSPHTVAEATRDRSHGPDEVIFIKTRFARGFARSLPEYNLSPADSLFGHSGMGGSFGYADPEARIGFAYTMNKMISSPIDVDPRWPRMFEAVYSCL
jgi:CubicO group peptidase (beta-lactamase class C family)